MDTRQQLANLPRDRGDLLADIGAEEGWEDGVLVGHLPEGDVRP